jgi:myo-inositol-1(or 4)-monophosphatase
MANGKLVQVSNRPLSQSLYYAGGKSQGQQRLNLAIGQECGLVKIIDSSSFEFAQIAMGDAEIYYLDNVPHDVVAGICIVREAGGKVTDGDGGDWRLDSATILATHGLYHDAIVDYLKFSVM